MERAREIVRKAHAINPSPSLLRIEAQLRSGATSARQLARLIEGSPALAARVLRMANSGFYAPQEPVVSLPRAVAMLGDTVLRQLVLTSLIASRRADGRSAVQAFAIARLMGDAVRTAVVAREVSLATRSQDPDSAFAAGLLHDLGHVYLIDEVGDSYARYFADGGAATDGLDTELQLSGTTHQDVGAIFAYDWNLPPVVAHVLWEHHDPHPATLSSVVRGAESLMYELSRPMEQDAETGRVASDAVLASLGLDRERWDARLPTIVAHMEELLTLFDAPVR